MSTLRLQILTREKLPLIEVGLTALAWLSTLTYDFDLRYVWAIVMTYLPAKVQGQQSVSSEDRVETVAQMDGGDCIRCCINAVCNDYF